MKYAGEISRIVRLFSRVVSLAFFNFPVAHRRLLRTTNGVERLKREIKKE
ncbi:MAG: hypothetical protein FXF49_05600 [Flexistipes sinusarabici]|uniref:Uncharacterized protein n=1 Tax=Flexistipes sinusarabici TaxID=2352 RepID=A0A5D0MRM5_FLESI|nr:MAG: hypothetical protein FXF49_05600 [Flexistipes sinusarabici]